MRGRLKLLRKAIADWKRRNGPALLRGIYSAIPDTTCARCGECCRESPGIHYSEFAHICDSIRRKGVESAHPDLVRRVLTFWAIDLMVFDMLCPFLHERSCIIYQWRPLDCRLFGAISADDRQLAIDKAQEDMQKTAEAFSSFGISLPDEVLSHKHPRCDRVRDSEGHKPTVDPRPLHAEMLRRDLEGEWPAVVPMAPVPGDASFSIILACFVFGPNGLDRKVAACRAYQEGRSVEEVGDLVMEGVTFRFADLAGA